MHTFVKNLIQSEFTHSFDCAGDLMLSESKVTQLTLNLFLLSLLRGIIFIFFYNLQYCEGVTT